jgi:hypothetical protein
MAYMSCRLEKQDYMHAHKHTRPGAHAHTHNSYCFSTATMIRKRTSVLRYTYTVCLVDPGTRWACVVNFTPWPLYPRERTQGTGSWVGPRASLDILET